MSKLNVDQKTIFDLLSDKKADFLLRSETKLKNFAKQVLAQNQPSFPHFEQ